MKILAIRGCNLASLAGEFEIDLAQGALGGTGVFAIVGNTGAGKSTLLDALCVALFDRTPRLTNHSRVVVGRGEEDPGALGAQDVRTLLRRGAAHGWAEVDFESGDGRRYRARWSVRRARGQVDGTLQAQQVALTALDGGERLGGTKTETLDEIHRRLGLTFDQFRRSALLAQGEFATFLRADGKDRSELLERMTGTSIYSRLSVQAHLRATLAAQRLADVHRSALAIAVLADDARTAAEADRALAEQARAAARARHAAAEAAARWEREHAARTDALASAEAARTAAISVDVTGWRDELALRRRAEAVRGAFDHAQRLERELTIALGEVAAAASAASSAASSVAVLRTRRAELAETHARLRDARKAAGLVERTSGRGDPQAALEEAAWLAARAGLAAEVAGWAELDAKFTQEAAAREAVTALDRAHRDAKLSRDRLAAERAKLVAERQAAVAKHGEAQRKAEAFQKRRGVTLDAARKQEDQARVRLTEVDALVSTSTDARLARDTRDSLAARRTELAAEAEADAAARTRDEAARVTALAVRGEREHALAELRKAAGYEHARTELVDGDPCPLCGSPEHPWHDRGAFDDAIAAARSRLAEVAVTVDALTASLASLEARAAHRVRELASVETALGAASAAADRAVARWGEQLSALGELSLHRDPLADGAAAYALDLQVAAKKRLDEARAVRSQTEAATKAAADAQAEVQLAQAHVDAASTRLADTDRRVAELEAALAQRTAERETRAERHAELIAELAAAAARWRAATSPPDARGPDRAWMTELASTWRAKADRVAQAEAQTSAAVASLEAETRAAETAAVEHEARRADAVRRTDEARRLALAAADAFEAARAGAGIDAADVPRLLGEPASRIDELVAAIADHEREVALAHALVAERRRLVDDHATTRPETSADAAQVEELARLVAEAEGHAARATATIAADDAARERRVAALLELKLAEGAAEVDRVLGEVIGSHDGKKFRAFAQSLTLDGLLAVANAHLEELAPRYQLERVPNHDLELQVIDRDLGEEVRSVQSLSGGESFLVSLALALGLSSMSAHDVRVRTLLIDEGFGTLDPATLDSALGVLDALQSQGRQVGVISHMPQLQERVGAHVKVIQRGGGRSEVIVA